MKKYISAIVILLALGVSAFLLWQKENSTTTDTRTQNATTTEQVASTTDIFSQPPIIPKAKVSTEGWKTCRNEEYGYEFKFPPEWHIYGADALITPDMQGKTRLIYEHASDECNGMLVILSPDVIGRYARYIEPARNVGVIRPKSQYAYEDMYNLATKTARQGVEQYIMLLDGNHALMRKSENYGRLSWSVTSWVDDTVYSATFPQYEDNVEIAETVFSTFRFLDTATSTTAQ